MHSKSHPWKRDARDGKQEIGNFTERFTYLRVDRVS